MYYHRLNRILAIRTSHTCKKKKRENRVGGICAFRMIEGKAANQLGPERMRQLARPAPTFFPGIPNGDVAVLSAIILVQKLHLSDGKIQLMMHSRIHRANAEAP